MVLLVAVIGVLSYMYVNKATATKTPKDIKGVYEFEQKIENLDNESLYCILALYENGTFHYEHGSFANSGEYGNYTIDGNTIILNNWFRHGSDVGAYAITGETRLKMNDDGTISDSTDYFSEDIKNNNWNVKDVNIKLTRASKDKEDEILKVNVNDMIKNVLFLTNETSKQ